MIARMQSFPHVAEGFGHVLGLAGKDNPVPRSHGEVFRRFLHFFYGRSEREAVEVGRDHHLAGQVLPVDLRRRRAHPVVDHISQRDQRRKGARPGHGQPQPFHLGRVLPQGQGQPNPNVYRVSILIFVGGHRLPAHQRAHGPDDIRGHHPRIHGPLPVHGQAEFGNVLLQGDFHVHDPGNLVDLSLQFRGVFLQQGDILAPDVDHQGFFTAPSRPFQDGRKDARECFRSAL